MQVRIPQPSPATTAAQRKGPVRSAITAALQRNDIPDATQIASAKVKKLNSYGLGVQTNALRQTAADGNGPKFAEAKGQLHAQMQKRFPKMPPKMCAAVAEEIALAASLHAHVIHMKSLRGELTKGNSAGAIFALRKMIDSATLTPMHNYVPFDEIIPQVEGLTARMHDAQRPPPAQPKAAVLAEAMSVEAANGPAEQANENQPSEQTRKPNPAFRNFTALYADQIRQQASAKGVSETVVAKTMWKALPRSERDEYRDLT